MKRETANALREEVATITKVRPYLTWLERGDYSITLRDGWTWKGVIAAAKANKQLDSLPLLKRASRIYGQEK